MALNADKNGVDVIISPVTGSERGVHTNIDFNFAEQKLHEMDNRSKHWDLKLMDGRRHVGHARFSAYQFMADGIERRTISLKSIGLEPRHRGQKKSYDIAKFVLETVTRECDMAWGAIEGEPLLFIEKKDMSHLPEKERNSFFDFLRKIGEKILGGNTQRQESGDMSVSVIGDNVSMQVIKEHLARSHAKVQ